MADQPLVVVTGAGGQVGMALRTVMPQATFATHQQLDVTDERAVTRALEGATCVVHLAAMTNVDRCQLDPDAAWKVNHRGTRTICRAAAGQARVIYLSTDYVFNGSKQGEYDEDDATDPINVYGQTKLAGETEVLATAGGLVIRTSWVFGEGANFVRSILSAARAKKRLRVVADQVGRPTSATGLAAAIHALVDRPETGVLHVSGEGEPTTWAGLAEFALRESGLPDDVEPISTAQYAAPAPRPANSTLSLRRARQLGVPLSDWRADVRRFVGSSA